MPSVGANHPPTHTALRRQDDPAHLREAPRKKRRDGFNNVVLGFEPGDMQRAELRAVLKGLIFDRAKAHECLHLVHVAAHGMGQMRGLHAVGVEGIVPQAGLVHEPPQQAVEQAKAARVAVQDDGFAQLQKAGRHAHCRCARPSLPSRSGRSGRPCRHRSFSSFSSMRRLAIGLARVRRAGGVRAVTVGADAGRQSFRGQRMGGAGKEIGRGVVAGVPAHLGGRHLLVQQLPRRLPEAGQVGGSSQHHRAVAGGGRWRWRVEQVQTGRRRG